MRLDVAVLAQVEHVDVGELRLARREGEVAHALQYLLVRPAPPIPLDLSIPVDRLHETTEKLVQDPFGGFHG